MGLWFALFFALSLCATVSPASEPTSSAPDVPLSPLPLGLNSFMPVPVANPMTAEKIDLGRKLFFDKNLSRDGTISCASCHRPDKAFTDGRALSAGVAGRMGRRNTPPLINCAYGKTMLWDGRAATLEKQALIPLTNVSEMASTLESVMDKLRADASYRALFKRAFGTGQITPAGVAQALASFQRTLVAANSPYDRYVLMKIEGALSEPARRGLELFRGKARCAHCHEGPLFTDQKFHNTGVSWDKKPLDLGRFEATGREEDKGKFKTPTLRQLTDTAPYMHDGSLKTLEAVVEFYDRGAQANPNLDPSIKPLSLSHQERIDLVTFLRMLSARATTTNSRFVGVRFEGEQSRFETKFKTKFENEVPLRARPSAQNCRIELNPRDRFESAGGILFNLIRGTDLNPRGDPAQVSARTRSSRRRVARIPSGSLKRSPSYSMPR